MTEHEAFDKLFKIHQDFYKFEQPCVGLQWKGSDICADFHCKCGAHGHLDANFVYYYMCAACGRIYDMPGWMPLRELTKEEIELLHISGRDSLLHSDPDISKRG